MEHEKHTLVSMRRPKKNREEATPMEPSNYSYGLSLRLENFELDKLNMELPSVGQKFKIYAVGKVENVSESQSSGNKGDRGVQIQITDLSIERMAQETEAG